MTKILRNLNPFFWLAGIIFLVIMAGCTTPSPTETASPTQAPQPTSAQTDPTQPTPEATFSPEFGYPEPVIDKPGYPLDTPIPEPTSDPANLEQPVFTEATGALVISLQYGDDSPIDRQQIFVAELLSVEGIPGAFVPAVDPNTAPAGFSDDYGRVVISNIPPGTYALSIMTAFGPVLIIDKDENPYLITVNANQVNDLGSYKTLLNAKDFEY